VRNYSSQIAAETVSFFCNITRACARAGVRACGRAGVRACVRGRARAGARARVHTLHTHTQDLVDLMEDTDSEFCREMAEKKVEKGIVIKKIVKQFNEVLDKHNAYDARWYNDDGHYRSAVTEMLTMKVSCFKT